MKKALGMIFVLALAATPAMAQKVTIDYAHDFDFSGAKTFQYVVTKDSNIKNELMADRIATMFKKELAEGGLKEVTENPDIYVTYHATSKENTSYNTTSMGYGGYGGYYGGWGGYGRYGGMGGMGSSTTYATTYTEGTLIFDAYEPGDKKLVWRGTGTVTVKAKPEKQIKQVDKILTKLGAKWDKILAGQGK
jgi:flagellin-like hook-associated protein FlgL